MVADAAKALADRSAEFLADAWGWLSRLDEAISRDATAGETTAVVGVLRDDGVFGLAVGDSAAWMIRADTLRVLTRGSEPKPWLGWGAAGVMPFEVPTADLGCLLLATDGLVKYAKASAICEVVRTAPFEEIPKRLIDLARMPNGVLQDDVAVVVARWEPGDENQQERG
jgi:serine/threonine protein phosphatase PrpC